MPTIPPEVAAQMQQRLAEQQAEQAQQLGAFLAPVYLAGAQATAQQEAELQRVQRAASKRLGVAQQVQADALAPVYDAVSLHLSAAVGEQQAALNAVVPAVSQQPPQYPHGVPILPQAHPPGYAVSATQHQLTAPPPYVSPAGPPAPGITPTSTPAPAPCPPGYQRAPAAPGGDFGEGEAPPSRDAFSGAPPTGGSEAPGFNPEMFGDTIGRGAPAAPPPPTRPAPAGGTIPPGCVPIPGADRASPPPPPPPAPDVQRMIDYACDCLRKAMAGAMTPVDMDQPLAMRFGEHHASWEDEAATWAGDWLRSFLASATLADFIAARPGRTRAF